MSDDAEVEVTVDGETERVSVASLKRLAGQERALREKAKKLQPSVKKLRRRWIKLTTSCKQCCRRLRNKLSRIKRSICSWRPAKWSQKIFSSSVWKRKQAEDNLKFLTEEADAFYGDIQKQQQAAHQEAAQQCVKTLQDEMPEWSNQLYNDIRGYAVSIGLPQEQVDQYTDPVVIQLINKARLYDEGKKVATVKKTKAATAKKVLRSKKAPDPKASKKAKADKARQDMIAKEEEGI